MISGEISGVIFFLAKKPTFDQCVIIWILELRFYECYHSCLYTLFTFRNDVIWCFLHVRCYVMFYGKNIFELKYKIHFQTLSLKFLTKTVIFMSKILHIFWPILLLYLRKKWHLFQGHSFSTIIRRPSVKF